MPSADDTRADGAPVPAPKARALWQRIRPVARPVLLVALSIAVGAIIVRLVGAVDWAQVGASLGQLEPWQALPLVAGLLVRQSFNAVPLARFVPGLGWPRSVQNDVTANLIGTVAPPPGDVVLRIAMFKSWGIDPVDGMAGVTLNTLTFYSVRFLAPSIGLLVLAAEGLERGQVASALLSALIAVAVLVALALVARGDGLAAWVGRTGGAVVRHVRTSVQPEEWARAVVEFRGRMAETLRRGLAPSMAALVAMVLADGTVLLMAQRFAGVGADAVPWTRVIGAFLLAYPLTLLPLAGLGVLDAALVAALVEIGGVAIEPQVVAGLIVWRVVTILGPLSLGTLSLLVWRRSTRLADR